MARRILKVEELNKMEVGESYKPLGTLGDHRITKIEDRLFCNQDGTMYQIPEWMEVVAYNGGELYDKRSDAQIDFETWQRKTLAGIESQIETLNSRFERGCEASFRTFFENGGGDPILNKLQQLNAEWTAVKAAKFTAPTKVVDLCCGVSSEFLTQKYVAAGFSQHDAEIILTFVCQYKDEKLELKSELLNRDVDGEQWGVLANAYSNAKFDKLATKFGVPELIGHSHPRKTAYAKFLANFYE